MVGESRKMIWKRSLKESESKVTTYIGCGDVVWLYGMVCATVWYIGLWHTHANVGDSQDVVRMWYANKVAAYESISCMFVSFCCFISLLPFRKCYIIFSSHWLFRDFLSALSLSLSLWPFLVPSLLLNKRFQKNHSNREAMTRGRVKRMDRRVRRVCISRAYTSSLSLYLLVSLSSFHL